jgi:hypothetical protein
LEGWEEGLENREEVFHHRHWKKMVTFFSERGRGYGPGGSATGLHVRSVSGIKCRPGGCGGKIGWAMPECSSKVSLFWF